MARMTQEGTNVLHFDYQWDLRSDRIILDEELNTDRLGWRAGDYFIFKNVDGKQMLVKVDPVVKFLKDGAAKNE
jgi:hypothetical protein